MQINGRASDVRHRQERMDIHVDSAADPLLWSSLNVDDELSFCGRNFRPIKSEELGDAWDVRV
jgi:hypothetical protein